MSPATSQYKTFARAYLRHRRRETGQLNLVSQAFTGHLRSLWESLPEGSTIAAFLPLPTEPPILDGLAYAHRAGHRVFVPVVLPQGQLAWVLWSPVAPLVTNALGISEPLGQRLGAEAFLEADIRLVPALAYDMHGNRLGQGGGYYDRLLKLLPAQAMDASTLGLVFSREILDGLPHAEWDATLNYALTEQGLRQLGTGSKNRVQ
ncbi:5-formyltetrahydrofolate cyclo-ligase [Rothia sp. CCM 9417]|uniref:5-formyltetrahydrofolate cyclo-ligase n=1 Tax=unclassified Rothia (in: high G+C Gram-positive bacteria) TaxID=2689056 RepID=UPI003AD119F8